MEQTRSTVTVIKNIYLYLVCFVALMMLVVATGDIIQIALKKYIFTKADQNMYGFPPPCPILPPTEKPAASAAPSINCAEQQAAGKKQADDNRLAQEQRDLVRDIAFILVGIPLFAYHWRVVRKKD